MVFSNTANEFTYTFGAKALDRPTVVNLTNHTYCEYLLSTAIFYHK